MTENEEMDIARFENNLHRFIEKFGLKRAVTALSDVVEELHDDSIECGQPQKVRDAAAWNCNIMNGTVNKVRTFR
jgi:hypothetical protein